MDDGAVGVERLEFAKAPFAATVRRPPARSRDVVFLLPGPALVRPPLAPLVAASLGEMKEGGVGDRIAADRESRDVDAMARALVVIGESSAVGADRARAARNLDQG